MADLDAKRIREIKIKTGVLKRLAKEKVSYEKETEKELSKVNKMKENNAEEHDLRKQQEVLEESRMMIPDCERRLKTAWNDLNKILETEADLAESEEYKAGKQVLEETRVAGTSC